MSLSGILFWYCVRYLGSSRLWVLGVMQVKNFMWVSSLCNLGSQNSTVSRGLKYVHFRLIGIFLLHENLMRSYTKKYKNYITFLHRPRLKIVRNKLPLSKVSTVHIQINPGNFMFYHSHNHQAIISQGRKSDEGN